MTDYALRESLSVEYAIIGAMIQFKGAVSEQAAGISPDDFLSEPTRELFVTLRDAPADDPARLLTFVPSSLRNTAAECMDWCPTPHGFSALSDRLRELANNRRVKAKLQEMALSAMPVLPDELAALAEQARGTAVEQEDIYESFKSTLGVKRQRIMTGYSHLDRMTGGLRIPSVSVIGAYPSAGKTALALNIAMRNENVLFFSLEMSTDMIIERMLSNKADIPYDRFETQDWTGYVDRWEDVKSALARFREQRISIFDDVYDIENQVAIASRVRPKLVVVDYIQKTLTRERKDSRRMEMDYISGQYKQMAKYNNCHVMVLSQLNRAGKDNPTMSSLKESGGLEADGDYVFLLNRPYVMNKSGHDSAGNEISPRDAWLLCDKNKFGRTGRIDMAFDGSRQRFSEVVYREDLPSRTQYKGFRDVGDSEPVPF